VNNVRYVQWVQDVAQAHWENAVPDSIRKNVVWVLIKHTISYKNVAVLGDSIRANTFIKENKGAICHRVVEMFNTKTDQLLVQSETSWCLLSSKSLKPMRIPDEIKTIFV
ncbi:MAG: acyl-ACP thioesterase domain-containing protein, partial [Bacteroidota bacterium]